MASTRPSVGVGLVTYERPELYSQVIDSYRDHLRGVVDKFYVQDDGSEPKVRKRPWFDLEWNPNEGVTKAKNRLFRRMLADGHDWIFIGENDVKVTSPLAVTGYINACERASTHHLNFHNHGPANHSGPVRVGAYLTVWPEFVGAWAIYSRESLEECGLFDENFDCAFEHVEHTTRLGKHGYHVPSEGGRRCADATGSENWLEELPGALESSTIRNRPHWVTKMNEALEYWSRAYPSTFKDVFH